MPYTAITLERRDRIATITLRRPDRRNALDDVLIREITEALQAVKGDPAVRVLVLTGEGKAFCAGMDLDYLRKVAALGEHENHEDALSLMTMLRSITALRKPVVAMVNGAAMGGGCGLAAACDFVFISSEHGKLGVPEVRIGFVPAVILPFLVRRMGEAAAGEFALSGGTLAAEAAVARGLATEAVPHERLAGRVAEFASGLADSTSPSSIALTKDLLNRISEMPLPDVLEYAARLNAMARKTDDFRLGLEAAGKKAPPRW